MAVEATLIDSVIGFTGALRRSGIPISLGESLDAARALKEIDLFDRAAVRTSLQATLIKREEHLALFADTFDGWFRARQQDAEDAFGGPGGIGVPGDVLDGLEDALRWGDPAQLRAAAAFAVAQFGGMDLERVSSARHHLFRVLRRLDLTRLLQRALAEAARAEAGAEGAEGDAGGQAGGEAVGDAARADAADRLARLRAHTAEFRRMVAEEVRARLAERTGGDGWDGRDELATGIDEVDFGQASAAELHRMQEAVRPLARRLATRLARRRQHRDRGRIDVRRTIRRSISSGGVPIDPSFRRERSSHPDLFVLCDLSGSVAEFARFTVTLLHALYRELPRTRLFVFVDGVDEVTGLIDRLPGTVDIRHLLGATEAVGPDGHSDYGATLGRFWTRFGGDVSSTATIIIAGDGRTNYRDPGTATLRRLHERARRLYWLNPEPRTEWDTADSNIKEYRANCDGLHEVRNLRQLADVIYQLT